MRNLVTLLILSLSLTVMSPAQVNAADEVNSWTLMKESEDYLELVRQYWPAATKRDVLALNVVYNALNNCGTFYDAIRSADNIDELDDLLQGRHPTDLIFAKGSYFKCKKLVEHYDEFPGWGQFRLQAAFAGDNIAKIYMAEEFYRAGNTRSREDFPFSPAEFLIDSIAAEDANVFGAIASRVRYNTFVEDRSEVGVTAWWLLYCKYYELCDDPASMVPLCSFMSPDCLKFKTMGEKIEFEAGSKEVYQSAQKRAAELQLAIKEKRYSDLGLRLVW